MVLALAMVVKLTGGETARSVITTGSATHVTQFGQSCYADLSD